MKIIKILISTTLLILATTSQSGADTRIKTEWKAGQYGLNAYDVKVLYLGARYHLKNGRCHQVHDGDKSVSRPNTYWINCGGPRNIFFKISDIPARF